MKKVSRRDFLRWSAVGGTSLVVSACAPQIIERTVEVTKEVEVEVPVEIPVEGETVVVTATPEPVSLYIWSYWTPPRDEALQASLDAFMDLHPEITAIHELLPSSGASEKVLTSIAGGEPPDILMLHSTNIPAYADQGSLMRLDKHMDRDGISSDAWFPADVGPCSYQNLLWGLPAVGAGTRPIFYNKGHLEEVGIDPTVWPPATSWEDLEELAGKLNVFEGGEMERMGFYPICRGGYYPRETDFDWFMVFNGGRRVSADFKSAAFDAPYREAMQWLVDLTDEYCGGFETAQAFMEYARSGVEDYNAPFYAGKLSMGISGPWEFTMVPDLAPDTEFDVFQVPNGPSYTEDFVTEEGYLWTWVIPNGAEYPDAAWKLLRWLTYDEGCGIFTRAMLRPPALISEAQTSFWEENIPQFPHYVEAMSLMPKADPKPAFPGFNDVSDQAMEEALRHNMTVDEACDWAAEESQKIIDEYWAKQA